MRSTIGPCGHGLSEYYNLTQWKVPPRDEVGMVTEGREALSLVAGLLLSSQWVLLRGNTNPVTADVHVFILPSYPNLKGGTQLVLYTCGEVLTQWLLKQVENLKVSTFHSSLSEENESHAGWNYLTLNWLILYRNKSKARKKESEGLKN